MPRPRLYHVAVPGFAHSRAFRCIWLFEELGIDDFEICMLNPGKPFTPQMRKYGVIRSQKIPTLQIDSDEISESGVISQVIAEKYQAHCSLLGTPAERLEMLQWIAMAETCITLRIPSLPSLMSDRKSLSELRSEVVQPMRQVFRENIARFETHFGERKSEYLLASGFSVADTMCGWSLHTFHSWGIMNLDTGDSPNTSAYLRRLQGRPAFKSAEKYAEAAPGLYGRGCVALPI
jgi:glutathione S-transferase